MHMVPSKRGSMCGLFRQRVQTARANDDLLGWIVLHHLATTSDFTTAAHLNRLETLSFASHQVLVGISKEGSDHLALVFTPPELQSIRE